MNHTTHCEPQRVGDVPVVVVGRLCVCTGSGEVSFPSKRLRMRNLIRDIEEHTQVISSKDTKKLLIRLALCIKRLVFPNFTGEDLQVSNV